jgi:hypothetical protein
LHGITLGIGSYPLHNLIHAFDGFKVIVAGGKEA